MVSSLIEMREEVRTWRRLGIGSLIAFFGLTLSLLAFGANLYRQNSDLSRQMMEGRDALHDANQKISTLQDDIKRISGNSEPGNTNSALSESPGNKKKPQ